MFKKPKKLFSVLSHGEITALDTSKGALRLIQLKRRAKHIELCKFIQIPLAEKEKLSELSSILEVNQIRIKTLVLSIPRHLITQKYLILPSSDPNEIQEMVKYQIQSLVPHSKEEIVFNSLIIGEEKEGYSKVMVLIGTQEVIKKHLSFLQIPDLEPDIVQLSSAALANWFFVSCREKFDSKTTLVLNIDSDSLDMAVVHNGKMLFSRGVATKEEALLSDIALETNRTLASFEKETGKKADQVLLSGERNNLPEMVPSLEKELSLPVQLAEPFLNISLGKSILEKDSLLTDYSLIRPLGLALGEVETTPQSLINFLPHSLREKRRVGLKKKVLLTKASLAAIALLLLTLAVSTEFYKRIFYLSKINKEMREIKPVASVVQDKYKKLEFIKKERNPGISSLAILSELYRITPDTITLNSFSLETDKGGILSGQAGELSQVFSYITTLEESPSFNNVKLRYASKKKIADAETVNFELYCNFSPPQKVE
ncbi:MAG: pilus assembly protein PilM [Candidatus Ratteibacteria bacterium]|jgi:Tfp pilus assembly PilM family ATPase